MFKKISFFFWLGIMTWILITVLRKLKIIIPFLNDYLTDLITIPMYTYLIYFVVNNILKRSWRPDLAFVLSSVLLISIIFEVICPALSATYTSDIKDVFCYLLGGIVYYFIIKKRGHH